MKGKRESLLFWSAECLRVIYWAYFKPFSMDRWLQSIDVKLDSNSNPFLLKNKFDRNFSLKNYARVYFFLVLCVPFFFSVVIGLVCEIFLFDFNWLGFGLFFLGWVIGLWISRGVGKYLIGFTSLLFSVILVPSMISVIFFPDFNIFSLPKGLLFVCAGVMVSVGFGISSGVGVGVGVGSAASVLFAGIINVAIFVAGFSLFRAFGPISNVAMEVTKGISLGFLIGVLGGAWQGVFVSFFYLLFFLRLYLWLIEFLWVCVLCIFRLRFDNGNIIKFLPPYYDEIIYLPLPFMARFIADAYRQNQTAARQYIDYLITSTNQQKTAKKALLLITVETATRCQSTSDIAATADDLAWLTPQVSRQVGPELALLLDNAREVAAARQATSRYRQAELLVRPIQKLKQLRDSLSQASADKATALGGIIDRWLSILETTRRTLEEQSRTSREIPPAYIAGPALDPDRSGNRFKGRIDLFREIETLVLSDQRPVLLLYGGRRCGKTSTLNFLPRRLPPSLVPLAVDVQGLAVASTLGGFAELLAGKMVESARLSRGLHLPPFKPAPGADPLVALQGWLEHIEQATDERTLVLCLDEYERLGELVQSTGSRAPLNLLRHLMQHRPRWALLFSGSRLLDDLPGYWSDYLIGTRALRISYLLEADARDLILNPVPDFPDIYPQEVVDEIIRLTRCQPYLVQLVCHELVERLNRDGRRWVELPDVEAVVPVVFERGHQYFREFWLEGLNEGQRSLLSALARGEWGVVSSEVARSLEKREILEGDGAGGWDFQVPLQRLWVAGQS